ncbi:uncharacterized protein [Nicotiana sylvestris]|uniref:uncharacterized protein n=1 Tax=Nicotiana sylvestris TaxID=4096 RepID=UPI00388C962F
MEDMLRGCVMDFGGSWDQFLPLVEFSYNNIYQLSIQLALYEALYGRWCWSPIGWFEPDESRLLGTDLVQDVLDKVKLIQDRLHTTESRQKSYVDRKVRDFSYMVGENSVGWDLTYDVEPMAILDRQVQKLRLTNKALVKVQWRGKTFEEANWETEWNIMVNVIYDGFPS